MLYMGVTGSDESGHSSQAKMERTPVYFSFGANKHNVKWTKRSFLPYRALTTLSLARRERLPSLSLQPSLKDKQAHKYTLPDWVRLQTPVRNQTPSPQQTRCSMLPLQARRRPTSTHSHSECIGLHFVLWSTVIFIYLFIFSFWGGASKMQMFQQ